MFSYRTSWKLQPNAFTLAQREIAAAGREVLDLTASNPTRVQLNYNADEILGSLSQAASLDYDPQSKGLLSARQAVAHYYREQHEQFSTDPEKILLTASTSEAYSHLFRLLCNPEDEILVPKPSYPLFDFLADLADVKVVPYPLIYDHGWQIDFHSFERAVREQTRAILLVHPNNPTGSYVGAEERARLNEICAAREIALIVDEVFLDYSHDGRVRPSFVTNDEALSFTLSGLSKISALPQMKLAWIAVSGQERLARNAMARLEVIADTYLSVSTPIQLAAPALLDQRRAIQPQLMARVQSNLCELDQQLGPSHSCSRLEVQGGWYAVIRVPAIQPDEDLAIALLRECSVLVHPGHFYDFPSDGYLVLSLIAEPEVFSEGISRILNFLKP